MARFLVLDAKQSVILATQKKVADELPADVWVIVPDLVRQELIMSGKLGAAVALKWIRDDGVLVSSTKAYEQYWSPAADGIRDAKLGEYANLAINEVKERYKCL